MSVNLHSKQYWSINKAHCQFLRKINAFRCALQSRKYGIWFLFWFGSFIKQFLSESDSSEHEVIHQSITKKVVSLYMVWFRSWPELVCFFVCFFIQLCKRILAELRRQRQLSNCVFCNPVVISVHASTGNVMHLAVTSGGQHHLISQPAQVTVQTTSNTHPANTASPPPIVNRLSHNASSQGLSKPTILTELHW